MTPSRPFTADEIEAGIARAVAEGQGGVIPGLLVLLARLDRERARAVADAVCPSAAGDDWLAAAR